MHQIVRIRIYALNLLFNMLLYTLRFGWWNVGLSPAAKNAKSKANSETYATLCNHLESLLLENSCDVLALCEVSSSDVQYFIEHLDIEDIEVLDLTHTAGRTRFDMLVIYNRLKVSAEFQQSLTKSVTGNTVKAAQVVKITNLDDDKDIYLYLCHWASRLNGDGEKRRISAADIVYNSATALMESGNDVIVMGDFNDNPYDKSVHEHLKANRCHDAVIRYPNEYFYNPFWRSVVSEYKYNHASTNTVYRSGTHKFKQFLGTIWHSYDQILVSGSFLTNSYWHLNEFRTHIISPDPLLTHYDDRSSFIDHLPVVCEVTRT